ncbi:transglutaminase [Niveispirillum lacus]|uniref:Transglutaminase n=1 Tax=Niveispirillum lacus TaxID=1981099 RepID=A0A255YVV3_9PROT|nr:transglutaminase family protein [Niveispirillum lacus]OYQ32814.1 transglutaminase [Niveispirillum lacus]
MPLPARREEDAVDGNERGAVRYQCRHVTRYGYGDPVTSAHMLAHLAPRDHPRQTCHKATLSIVPWPGVVTERHDWFGNPVTYAALHTPHRELTVTAEIEVTVAPPPPLLAETTPCWEEVAALAATLAETAEFVRPSARVPLADTALTLFAAAFFSQGRAIGEGALDLTRRIHADFSFDPTATTISTPISEVLARKRGVCQDFAHLMIGALRALGLPARYVSGYLRTLPPPGKPKLQGADASHAWVQAWCGPHDGWIDLDPTNGRQCDTDHVTLAWGRDYDDVCPLRGVILGGGHHGVLVAVDVDQLDGR